MDDKPMEIQSKRARVSGIERSVQIMDLLSELGHPVSAYEIAKTVGAPVSTIYAIVAELQARDLLTRTPDNTIWLGPKLLRYGIAYEAKMDLLGEAKHEMVRLAHETGETVQVCFRDEGYMTVVAMVDGVGHFRISSDVGTRVPLNWTASGRLLLGHLPADQCVAAFAAFSKPSPTGLAETDPKLLAAQASKDFSDRLAVQLGASEFAVACIAAPVRDETGACSATISIVLSEAKARSDLDTYANAVRRSAETIERNLGRVQQ